MKGKTIIETCSGIILFLLAYTAISEQPDYISCQHTINKSPFFSYSSTTVAALALPITGGMAFALFTFLLLVVDTCGGVLKQKTVYTGMKTARLYHYPLMHCHN